MDLKSIVTWSNNPPPEYILEGQWFMNINDNLETNTVYSTGYLLSFDNYISEVNIPQIGLNYDKTDFDMLNFKERDNFSSFNISFYDDIKARCLNFFSDWIDSIYDVNNNCVRKNWRYEKKDMQVVLIRIMQNPITYGASFLKSTVSNIAGGYVNAIQSLKKDYIDVGSAKVIVVAEYDLKGCLPKGINEITVSDDSGDRQQFTVGFDCEMVKSLYGSNLPPSSIM